MHPKKLTKIVATISDRRCDIDFLRKLHDAGMDVIRINTAHASIQSTISIIENARKVSDKIAILIDTKGPEIRTTAAPQPIELKKDDLIYFEGNCKGTSTRETICVTYDNFVEEIRVGVHILIDDGSIAFVVVEKKDNKLLCKVLNDGFVNSRKGVNVPGEHINLPSLTDKDRDFIKLAIEQDIAFIAHSFVRNKHDVLEVQKILDQHNSDIKIIAKIENREGVDNIDEILHSAFGVMIARGDLGIEIPAEKIPAIQKEINMNCIIHRKPVIVATQMLHTMIENPRPTRAEVSDVANAIYDGADAIMLSGETANGLYPVEAVETMTKIAIEVESLKKNFKRTLVDNSGKDEVANFLAKSAVQASVQLNSACIIADTLGGSTIRNLAAFRGNKPIYAMCYRERTMRELVLSYGVYVEHIEKRRFTEEFLHKAVSILINKRKIDIDDLLVILAGNFGPGIGATHIEVSSADNLIKRY